jgi:hypothetical protein
MLLRPRIEREAIKRNRLSTIPEEFKKQARLEEGSKEEENKTG